MAFQASVELIPTFWCTPLLTLYALGISGELPQSVAFINLSASLFVVVHK